MPKINERDKKQDFDKLESALIELSNSKWKRDGRKIKKAIDLVEDLKNISMPNLSELSFVCEKYGDGKLAKEMLKLDAMANKIIQKKARQLSKILKSSALANEFVGSSGQMSSYSDNVFYLVKSKRSDFMQKYGLPIKNYSQQQAVYTKLLSAYHSTHKNKTVEEAFNQLTEKYSNAKTALIGLSKENQYLNADMSTNELLVKYLEDLANINNKIQAKRKAVMESGGDLGFVRSIYLDALKRLENAGVTQGQAQIRGKVEQIERQIDQAENKTLQESMEELETITKTIDSYKEWADNYFKDGKMIRAKQEIREAAHAYTLQQIDTLKKNSEAQARAHTDEKEKQ